MARAARLAAEIFVIGLLQRVTEARVLIQSQTIAQIGSGLAVLVGVEKGDAEPQADRLLERLLTYRVFSDGTGRMNVSLQASGGGLLLVPQFTLAADTHKGSRPGFSTAASPDEGARLFGYFACKAQSRYPNVAAGRFGAHMQLQLTNDGPVTFWLRVAPSEPYS